MPAEIRHLLFTADEVSAAIRGFCLGSGRILPAHAIFTVDGGPEPYVRVSSPPDRNQCATTAVFSGEALIAPLLQFCQKQKIPLPRIGAKEITTIDDKLTLIIKLI